MECYVLEKLILVGEIDVNSYILESGNKCFIIDPGAQKERLKKYVEDKNLSVEAILLTHAHFDHIGALDAFDVPVYLHEFEMEIIKDNNKNGYGFYGIKMPYDLSKINLKTLRNGEKLKLNDEEIEVILTQGHTVGSVCYKMGDKLYSGDTLFENGIGRYDFPTGDVQALRKSIVMLIDTLDEAVKVFPGHGNSSTIGMEKQSNSYYKMWKR